MKDRGHRVTILTGKPNYPTGTFFEGYTFWNRTRDSYLGCEVIRAPLLPRGKGRGRELAGNFVSFALFASLLAPFLCRGSYDLIFVYEPSPITVGFPAIVMKKLLKKPLFFWVQDLWPESLSATGAIRSPRLLALVERMVKYIYKHCDRILVQSQKFREPIEGLGAPRERIVYFPNWAESYYRPQAAEEAASRIPFFPSGFTIVFAGNFGAAQDLPTLLDAAERVKRIAPDVQWGLVGDGRMKDWVEREIAARGLEQTVHLLGKHPPEQMPDYFSLAGALVVTLKKSHIFSLTLPSKLQSYFACGKPILSALDGEGNRIVEESGAGVSCPSENAEALAEAALTLYRMSPEARSEMGRRGLNYYAIHFDREVLIDKLEGLMQDDFI